MRHERNGPSDDRPLAADDAHARRRTEIDREIELAGVRQLEVNPKSRPPADSHANRGGQRRAPIAERRTEGERRVSFDLAAILSTQRCRTRQQHRQTYEEPKGHESPPDSNLHRALGRRPGDDDLALESRPSEVSKWR